MSSLIIPFRPSDIPTGLVGYWKFNNDATDSSASGYHLNGAPEVNVNSGLETWTGLTNLVTNGNMETGSPPSTWILQGAGATWAREGTIIKTGTYSGKLTRSGTDTQVYQNVGGAGLIGKTIVVRAWVWCNVANKAAVWVGDGGGGGTSYWDYHPGDSQWHYMTGYVVVGGSTTAVYAYCHIDSTDCSAYFDDFICYEQLPPTNWAFYAPNGGVVYQESEYIKTGTYSAKATSPEGYTTQLYQTIASPGSYSGKTMIFSAWCKCSVASKARLQIYTAGATSPYVYSSYHTGSGNWERLTCTLTLPASCTDFWTLMNLTGSTGGTSVYWDETNCYESLFLANGNYWKDAYSANLVAASSQYFSIDASPFSGRIMLSVWVRPATATMTAGIMSHYYSATANWDFYLNSGVPTFKRTRVGATDIDVAGTTVLQVGRKYHIVYMMVGDDILMFVDGNLEGRQSLAFANWQGLTSIHIGHGQYFTTNYFNGEISDLGYWNATGTPIQAKSLALGVDLANEAYRPNNVSVQPTHWWKLNEPNGIRYGALNLASNGSFEIGDPSTGWALTGAGATTSRSTEQVKVGTYSAKVTRSGANCYILQDISGGTIGPWRGKTLTVGCWVYATVASTVYISINDNVGGNSSTTHSGGSTWEWLTVTYTISSTATAINVFPTIITTDQSAYFDGLVVVVGSTVSQTSTASPYNGLTLADNNTVLSSGGYVEGIGAKFDRANTEYLSTTSDSDFNTGTDSFTWRARFKMDALLDGTYVVYSPMCQYVDASNHRVLYVILTGGVYYLAFYSYVSASFEVVFSGAIPTPSAGVFYDSVLRRNGNDYELFWDGVSVATTTDSSSLTTLDGNFYVGWSGAANQYMHGVIEDMAFWKGYALSDAEIKSLACALPIQQQGIVSYWKGANVNDSYGTNTLTDAGIVGYTTDGKVGKAMDFEVGDSKYLSLANNDSIDITSDMAIFSWVKPESVGIVAQILDKDMTGDGYGLFILNDNKVGMVIANDADYSTTSVAAGTWAHCFGNYDGASKAMWINGVLEGNGAFTTNPADVTSALRLGALVVSDTYFLDGLLNETLLAKRYFRPEEIKAVYLKGLNGKEATSSSVVLTNIKSVAGVLYASIKKISSVAIASVGKVGGLA